MKIIIIVTCSMMITQWLRCAYWRRCFRELLLKHLQIRLESVLNGAALGGNRRLYTFVVCDMPAPVGHSPLLKFASRLRKSSGRHGLPSWARAAAGWRTAKAASRARSATATAKALGSSLPSSIPTNKRKHTHGPDKQHHPAPPTARRWRRASTSRRRVR